MPFGIGSSETVLMPQELTVSEPQKIACHIMLHSLYKYVVNVYVLLLCRFESEL